MSQHIDWESVDARIEKKMKFVSKISRLQAHVDFAKVIFVVIVTVLIFNTGLIFNMNSNVNAKLSTLSDDVSILKTNYTNMQSDITNMQSDITSMQSDITNLRADVTNLQDDMVLVKRKLEIE